jgi:hypothetical protein
MFRELQLIADIVISGIRRGGTGIMAKHNNKRLTRHTRSLLGREIMDKWPAAI